MGTIDVPAFIDFITAKTGVPSASYVGHSEGTTQMFMGLSLMPEYYKEKVNVFAAMAPPVYIKGITDPMTLTAASHWKLVMDVFEEFGIYNFVTLSPQLHEELAEACDLIPFVCELLEKTNFLIPEVDNMSRGTVMLSNFPGGSGYRNTVYYG